MTNLIKRIIPRDPPWITKPQKTMLNKKNRLYKNYKRHGCINQRTKLGLTTCQEAVKIAKLNYLTNMGNKLNNPKTSQKSYWKMLVDNLFIQNCREKPELFTDFFSQQCKPVINHSVLPNLNYLTNEKIQQIPIENEDVISLIRKLNPNKPNRTGISGQMLLLYDFTKLFLTIFTTILRHITLSPKTNLVIPLQMTFIMLLKFVQYF